jgi:GcrA cell cycle regulator
MNGAGWTPGRDAELRALWDDRGLSTNEIGRRMGVTKNAVVGRAHRLNLPKRESPIRMAMVVMDDAQRETLRGLIIKGFTREQCARAMGVGRDLVMREAKRLVAPRVKAASQAGAAVVARARAAQNSIGAAEGFRTRGAEGGGTSPGGLAPAPHTIPAAMAGDPGPAGFPGDAPRFLPRGASSDLPSSTAFRPAPSKAPAVFSKRCRFPLWGDRDRPTHRFCDEATALGAYCAEHAARCYVPPRSAEPRPMGPTVGWGAAR